MKKILLMLLLVLISISQSNSATVNRIVGLNADCGNACQPIPLNVTVLCSGANCSHVRMMPSLNDNNRLWSIKDEGFCRTSIDGGITWSNCPTNPFTPATGSNALIAGAADGSVIAVARQSSPERCEFKKSVDNGVTWILKFTDSVNGCQFGVRGNRLRCFSNGVCVNTANTTSGVVVWESFDNGDTWSVVFGVTNGSPPGATYCQPYMGEGKNFLDSNFYVTGCEPYNSGSRGINKINGVWSSYSKYNGSKTDLVCSGLVFISDSPYGVCSSSSSTEEMVNLSTGLPVKNPVFNPAISSVSNSVPVAVAISSNTIYAVGIDVSSRTVLYVSNDGGSSYVGLYVISNTAYNVAGIWKHPINGCIYTTAQDTFSSVSTVIRVC